MSRQFSWTPQGIIIIIISVLILLHPPFSPVHSAIGLSNATSSQWSIYQIRNPIFMDFVTLSAQFIPPLVDRRRRVDRWLLVGSLHDPSLFSIGTFTIPSSKAATRFIANGRLRLPALHRFSFDSFQSNTIRRIETRECLLPHGIAYTPSRHAFIPPRVCFAPWEWVSGGVCWSNPITIIELNTLACVLRLRK